MAFFAKQFSLFLLLTSLLSTHARESQFFNKIPSTTNDNTNNVVPNNKELTTPNNNQQNEQQQQQQQQEPDFIPETENSYGLYGHESGQLPPSTTTTTTAPFTGAFEQPAHKYLPKNYNPVAYVTKPEDDVTGTTTSIEETAYTTNPNTNTNNNNNYYNGEQNYYNNQQLEQEYYKSFPTTNTNNRNKNDFYYNGGSSFNSQPQGLGDARFGGVTRRERYGNAFQPQGMSDTRFMENGKYFYDVDTEKYSTNHPYESLRYNNNNRNYYGNGESNAFEFNNGNSMGGYNNQNQDEFQDEDINMP